jgi:hypothetical protein
MFLCNYRTDRVVTPVLGKFLHLLDSIDIGFTSKAGDFLGKGYDANWGCRFSLTAITTTVSFHLPVL